MNAGHLPTEVSIARDSKSALMNSLRILASFSVARLDQGHYKTSCAGNVKLLWVK